MYELQIITYVAENASFTTLPCFFPDFCPGFLVLCSMLFLINIPLLSKNIIMLSLEQCNSLVNIIFMILSLSSDCMLYLVLYCISHNNLTRNQCYPFVNYLMRHAIYPRPHSQDLNHWFSFSKISLVYYFRAHKILTGIT